SELAPQHRDEEVPTPTGWLKNPRVDAFGLGLHEVKHRLDHPLGCKDLPMVSDPLLRLHKRHKFQATAARRRDGYPAVLTESCRLIIAADGLPCSIPTTGRQATLLEPRARHERLRREGGQRHLPPGAAPTHLRSSSALAGDTAHRVGVPLLN